jgi:CRISPR-associated protein Csx17
LNERSSDSDWAAATWEGSRRAQLRRALSLTVRQRLEVLESLSEASDHIAEIGREAARSERRARPLTSTTATTVREAVIQYGGEQQPHVLRLPGCTPAPLASYLKALGFLRLVAEQKDPDARGWWEGEAFHLRTRLSFPELCSFFLHEYAPTPILSPWSGRAGFLEGEQEGRQSTRVGAVVLRKALDSSGYRWRPYRDLIIQARNNDQLNELDRVRTEKKALEKHKKDPRTRVSEKAAIADRLKELASREKHLKATLLVSLRAELPDETVEWIDACFAVGDEDIKVGALLGTGGNEGSMDFSINHLQLLQRLFEPDGSPLPEADHLLRGALTGKAVREWRDVNPGLLAPASVGGANMGSGFNGAGHGNPWDAVLMLEGALFFSATATRKQGASPGGRLSFPFAVEAINAGHGGVGAHDKSRPEIWAPLWDRPASFDELTALFAEGRLTLRRKPARTALDAARAVALLGADRGVTSFQRFGFFERRGQGYYVTVPLERRIVLDRPLAGMLDQLDRHGWLARFRRLAVARGAPARLGTLVRRLEDGIFEVTRGDSAPAVQSILATLGEAQSYLAASPKARAASPPVPGLHENWMERADDGSAEYRIAAALAAVHANRQTGDGKNSIVLPIAVHLAPMAVAGPPAWDEEARQSVVWRRGSLVENLAAVVRRRLLDAEALGLTDKPFMARTTAPLAAVSSWLNGDVDTRRIAELLPGLSLVRRFPRLPGSTTLPWPIPVTYALFKPFFSTDAQLRRIGLIPNDSSLPLPAEMVALLAAGAISEAARLAVRRLTSAGITPFTKHIETAPMDGNAFISMLLVPISDRGLERLIRIIHRAENGQSTSTSQPQD